MIALVVGFGLGITINPNFYIMPIASLVGLIVDVVCIFSNVPDCKLKIKHTQRETSLKARVRSTRKARNLLEYL